MQRAMQIVLVAVLLCSGVGPPSGAAGEVEFAVTSSPAVDLGYHLLAHMNIAGNTASLFDQAYVAEFRKLRATFPGAAQMPDLQTRLQPLADLIGRDQAFLEALMFLPMVAETTDDMITALAGLTGRGNGPAKAKTSSFLQQFRKRIGKEAPQAASEFLDAILEERPFYEHWSQTQEAVWHNSRQGFERSWLAQGAPLISRYLADAGARHVKIVLSPSMRRNGRVLTDDPLVVVVYLPRNEGDLDRSFFFALHEMIHVFSDRIVAQAGYSPGARSTSVSQDGYLIQKYLEGCALLSGLYITRKDGAMSQRYADWLNGLGIPVSGSFKRQIGDLTDWFRLPESVSRRAAERFGG